MEIGASIFFTFSVGPAVFSSAMREILGSEAFPGYSGRIAIVFVDRYCVLQQVCSTIALVHLVAEWLYMGKPLQRLTLWLLLGICSIGLVGGYSLQPKLRSLHRTIYGPGFMKVEVPLLSPGAIRPRTFYNQHGDVFGWVCVLIGAGMLVVRVVELRKSRNV